ncbi:MAG TPA: isoprenylcysteine carboxylmethyltransferase family protein [Desulfosporosinus sp.]|jgi:protein-S-isoprenylcysteine O-methyltransferase Ste14|nr:isoprenylcysteine carboxylmethyltransferase family protein [Desulfosporosinus sp.]
MQGYFAIIVIILLMAMVLSRVFILKRQGIKVMRFGEMDKKDFLIPPFALLFFGLIFSHAFNLPKVGSLLFESGFVSWIGVVVCIVGLIIFLMSLIAFGKSFRVGIDEKHPGKLVTTGIFAYSRNPIYTAFGFILLGIFLILPNWIFLIYLVLGFWLFNRQVLLEEASLRKHYGEEYTEYCIKVGRFF